MTTRRELLAWLWQHQRRTAEHIEAVTKARNATELKRAIHKFCDDVDADVHRAMQEIFYRVGLSDKPERRPAHPVPWEENT